MLTDIQEFDPLLGLLKWVAAVVVCAGVAAAVAVVISLSEGGMTGPATVWSAIRRAIGDLLGMSMRRVAAIAGLTMKESIRRQDVLVGVVFVLLFMFAGWFLSGSNVDTPAKPYISFVLMAIRWLTIPVALLLACWGLPADIKTRTLHTVVTKPVRRTEIVLGRMLGYSAILTVAVALMGGVGYVWIVRHVPEDAQSQLVSRVPVYGELSFITRTGDAGRFASNVGDMWDFRSFIEGNTRARAVYQFDGLDVDRIRSDDGLQLEYRFELFRSHKGDIEREVQAQLALVNEAAGLRVPYPPVPFEVREFAEIQTRSSREGGRTPIVNIPRKLTYTPEGESESRTVDLYDDLMKDGQLTVEVRCVDSAQYLGAARTDLFIRSPDKPFLSGYSKAILGTWMMALLVVVLGTTASTFVKGPVATLLTFTLVLTGLSLRPFMSKLLGEFRQDKVVGGGVLESAYRIVTQMNQQSPLPEGAATSVIKWVDSRVFEGLLLLQNVIPDFTHFDMAPFVANGFDVPWNYSMMPAIATTVAFVLPCLILGYFCLQWRELEAK